MGSGFKVYEVYEVQPGDMFSKIANQYETTEGILKQINGLGNDMMLSSGMMIVVPVDKKQPYQYYTVKKGDNLHEIAKKNDVDYGLLLQLNGLDPDDYIYPNQTIMLPKKGFRIYLTMENDTLKDVIEKFDATVEELLMENEKIYLRPEQIVVFRDK